MHLDEETGRDVDYITCVYKSFVIQSIGHRFLLGCQICVLFACVYAGTAFDQSYFVLAATFFTV